MINIIVAYDQERGIGSGGKLLWSPGEMKTDMRHFRELTRGSTIVMGRKTLDSIGMALPQRRNIVVSRQYVQEIPNVDVVTSVDEAFTISKDDPSVFVIGGGEIYQQALERVNRIYATEVHFTFPAADVRFPVLIEDEWRPVTRESHQSDADNIYDYEFVTYERK